MTPEIETAVRERVAQALAWDPASDPEPVTEALAYLLALDVLGVPLPVSAADRTMLRRQGAQAALRLPPDDEDRTLERDATAAALDALDGQPPARLGALASPLRPTPSRTVAFLDGGLDGFAALAVAARLALDAPALQAVRGLVAARSPAAPAQTPIALAAAAAPSVRPPLGGRPIGRRPGVEALLFEDDDGGGPVRRIAVYAEEDRAVRLEADGLVQENVRPGYWIGRLTAPSRSLQATLQLGDDLRPWVLELDPDPA